MNKTIRIVYDKQCPVCDQYCLLAEKHTPQEVTLIDARQSSELMNEITRRGLDIDDGMVVEVDGVLHYGADAIHALALLSPRSGVFNFVNRVMFQNAKVARFMYPLLRSCRNVLLKILGISRINNLRHPNNRRF
ncbi:MAG: DCC1-like thiol-disulfide oxidoreductase family protein [Pseudomonadota bacterium]